MISYRLALAEGASLQATKKGDVLLQIRDVLYEPRDVIPKAAIPETPLMNSPGKWDARSFVLQCCVYQYGPNHSHWPDLARSFVDEDGHYHPTGEKTLRRSHADVD